MRHAASCYLYSFMRIKVNLLFVSALIVFSSSLCTVAQIRPVSQAGCDVVNKRMPLVFISYERLFDDKKKSKRKVRLRLQNNSTCGIAFLVAPAARESVYPHKVTDGALIEVLYEIPVKIEQEVTSILWPPGIGHEFFQALLEGGSAVLFDVPLDMLKNRPHLQVEFMYEWEIDKTGIEHKSVGGGKYVEISMKHYVYFPYDRLPGELLK